VEDPSKVRLLAKATRHGQITYRSVLFSRPGSPIKSLEDLNKARDLRAAWVDPSSATGYLFAKALLLKRKIDPAGIFRVQDFLWTHDALCTAVQSGKADVGATFSDDPTGEPAVHATGCQAALGDKVGTLQIIAATEPIPYEVLAVRAGLPEVERAALLAAVYELEKNEEGRKVLADAFHCQGFTGASDRDYDMVRAETGTFAQ
jgi:phosphonate transport system substrate-binding protein